MSKYTPMIEQYLAIKREVPDAFLFFRLGDFYELFFEDAVEASRELEITLTGRDGGAEQRIPMCGVPYHSAENYIARLTSKGYKVAICEQVEDPSEAKGVVRREIVRIVTPGTVMETKSLEESANNYIVSVTGDENRGYGLAACDLSTGELYVTRITGPVEQLADELNVYKPSELIGPKAVLDRFRKSGAGAAMKTVFSPWEAGDDENVSRHFDPKTLAELPAVCMEAVSVMMTYLVDTQKRALMHVKQIRLYETEQFMTMDSFTRRNLELVETVRERTKKGSLYWLLDKTVTAMGGRRLRRWIEKPLLNKEKIEARLEAVDCLYNQFIVREELRRHLKQVYDLERLVGRIAYGNANARDLLALKISLSQMPPLLETCRNSGSATLAGMAARMDPCEDVMEKIAAAIVDDPPVSVRDGGIIREGYHDYLDKLREASANGKQWIAELEKKEREATGIKSLKIGYNKVFGYYIEVTRANIGSLPEGRYERKQTLANAERFVTPELKEKEALILEAQEKMVDLEYELFMQLRKQLMEEIPRLQQLADVVAEIDALQSLAEVSAEHHYSKPAISEGYDLVIKDGRHPVVEAVLEGSFIANDTRLQADEARILLITGPNMAGKSTYMRQVAIICLMAQIGCFVPAASATIPLVDRIFTRIGAADDLVGGQSTFMVEMRDIQAMASKATERSLVIIDELGRGTSTGEGMAIAQAVIEHLHHHIGCKTLVSTHFHELAHLEDSLAYLRNYSMAVKESDRQVTFLRKLIPGAASTSYGIYCARIAGLPDSIIERAYDLLNRYEARAAVQQGAAEASAAAVQLSLFPEEPEAPANAGTDVGKTSHHAARRTFSIPPGKSERTAGGHLAREREAEVVKELADADLINMTPLQAMNFIYELKQKLQGKL